MISSFIFEIVSKAAKKVQILKEKLMQDREKFNILMDIDWTVCTGVDNEFSHLYPTAKVFDGAVKFVNDLYDKGHRITFFTARESKDREVTVEWLNRHGFKYHQLIMDKPRAIHGNYRWVDDIPVKGFQFKGDYKQLKKELND